MQITQSDINLCVSISKNCKNWLKFNYSLPNELNYNFLEFLKQFGKVEVLDFSKFSQSSKIFYKLKLEESFTVEGVLFEKIFLVTVDKKFISIYEIWQDQFQQWYKQNHG